MTSCQSQVFVVTRHTFTCHCLLASLQSVAPALASVNQVPLEKVQETLAALPAEWEHYGTGCGGVAVWAQKP